MNKIVYYAICKANKVITTAKTYEEAKQLTKQYPGAVYTPVREE